MLSPGSSYRVSSIVIRNEALETPGKYEVGTGSIIITMTTVIMGNLTKPKALDVIVRSGGEYECVDHHRYCASAS